MIITTTNLTDRKVVVKFRGKNQTGDAIFVQSSGWHEMTEMQMRKSRLINIRSQTKYTSKWKINIGVRLHDVCVGPATGTCNLRGRICKRNDRSEGGREETRNNLNRALSGTCVLKQAAWLKWEKIALDSHVWKWSGCEGASSSALDANTSVAISDANTHVRRRHKTDIYTDFSTSTPAYFSPQYKQEISTVSHL